MGTRISALRMVLAVVFWALLVPVARADLVSIELPTQIGNYENIHRIGVVIGIDTG